MSTDTYTKVDDTALNQTIHTKFVCKEFCKDVLTASNTSLKSTTSEFFYKKRAASFYIFLLIQQPKNSLLPDYDEGSKIWPKCTHIYQFILIDQINLCKLVNKAQF